MTPNKQISIEEIDFKKVLIRILKKWYVFAIVGIIAISFAIYKILSSSPKYLTEASIIIPTQDDALASTMKQFSLASHLLSSKKEVNDEIVILKSKNILQDLIEILDLQTTCTYTKRFGKQIELYKNEPIAITLPENFKQNIINKYTIDIKKQKQNKWDITITQKVGLFKIKHKSTLTTLDTPVKTQWGEFCFTEQNNFIDPQYPNYEVHYTIHPQKSSVQQYNSKISISLSNKKANAINIEIIGGNIQKNEIIVNTLIELYQQFCFDQKLQNTSKLESFLTDRINVFDQELKILEEKIEKFRIEHNLTDILLESENSLTASLEYSKLLTEVDMELSVLAFIDTFLKETNELELIPTNTFETNETLSQLIITHNTNVQEYLKLTQTSTENNPYTIQLKKQILLSRKNILQTISNMKKGAEQKRSSINSKYTEINNKISNIPSIEKELLSMEREKEIKQKIYLFLLQKKEETQFVMTSSNSTGLIIDKAYTFANSITPNTKQTLCFAIIITILISLCYIYIEYIFAKKIYNKDQIKDLTAINIIGEITSPEQNNELELINKPNNEKEINSFRTIRTALQLINKEKAKNQTILITSTTNDSCNNYIAINLALSYANLKKKTILINLNLHNPTKYEYLDNTKGISEYLWDDECQLTEIIQNHYQNQYLSLISSGCKIENPTEALNSDKLITLMDFLRNNFEYIIVDTTPITKETPDTLLLGSLANTTLFICKKKSTQKADIKALNKFIDDKILNNVHIIFEQTT